MFASEGDSVNVGRHETPAWGDRWDAGRPREAADGNSDVPADVVRRLQGRIDRHTWFLGRMQGDLLQPEPPGLGDLLDTARRMRRDTESLLLMYGRDPGVRVGAACRLSDVLGDAASAAEEPRWVDVRTAPAATLTPAAATELTHIVAELIDHVLAVYPGARVDVAGRVEEPAGLAVEVRTDGAARHDPDALGGRPALAAAERLAQRSHSGIAVRRSAGTTGTDPVATVHCPSSVVTIEQPERQPMSWVADRLRHGPSRPVEAPRVPPAPRNGNGYANGHRSTGSHRPGTRPPQPASRYDAPATPSGTGSHTTTGSQDTTTGSTGGYRTTGSDSPDGSGGAFGSDLAFGSNVGRGSSADGRGDTSGRRDVGGNGTTGFGASGYDASGYDASGHDTSGYDTTGYDTTGYDASGNDSNGYDSTGNGTTGYGTSGDGSTGYGSTGYGTTGYGTTGYGATDAPAQADGYAAGYSTGGDPTPGGTNGVHRSGSFRTGDTGSSMYGTPSRSAPLPPVPSIASPSARPPVDELFGPLIDLPLESSEDEGATPIFAAIASAWFREDAPEPVAGRGLRPNTTSDPVDWETPSDREWREAAARAAQPDPAPLTANGLPRRRPGNQLVPPRRSRVPIPPPEQAERVPDRVRDRLSTYQRGLRQGRHRAEPPEHRESAPW